MREKINCLIVAWTIGILGGLIFCLLKLIGIIQIHGYRKWKFIHHKTGMLVIYRHPSLREPALLPFLFFPWFLFNPRLIPFSTPTKHDFYDKWWFWPIRPVCIPVDGGNLKGLRKALEFMKKKLNQGGILILAPGGGREFKGTSFKRLKNGKIDVVIKANELSYSDLVREASGKIIRRFQSGIGWILDNTVAEVIPIWVDNTGMRTEIIIGEIISSPKGLSREEVIEFWENAVLSLKTS